MKRWKPIKLEHNKLTDWNWMVQYPGNLTLGERIDIGAFCYINAHYGVTIGNDVQIGSHTSIYSHNSIDKVEGSVTIGDGACIGAHSTIMPGVKIGKNAIVGAYSFVKKNVPEGGKVWGIPASPK